MSGKKRVAVLISGRGSNMTALIAAAKAADYPCEIALVLSNRPGAKGLETARAEGIETVALDHKQFNGRECFERAMQATLVAHGVELVALAGFMRLLTPWFVGLWEGRMINIHPALLPSFKGLHTHERALEAGVKIHGCTVHWVTPGMDEGPIVAQAALAVRADDTADTLGARVLGLEHKLYPAALAHVATNGYGAARLPATDALFAL